MQVGKGLDAAQAVRDSNPTQSRDILLQIIEGISEGVYFVNANAVITYWNKGAEELTGYKRQDVMGRECHFLQYCGPNVRKFGIEEIPVIATIRSGQPRSTTVFLLHEVGHRVPVWITCTPIFDEKQQCIGAVEVFDRSSNSPVRQRRRRDFNDAQFIQADTGVRNRVLTKVRIDDAIEFSKVKRRLTGLIYVDIDGLNQITLQLGPDGGNRVLRMVAQTMDNCLRVTDFVGHWEDDHFVVIVDIKQPADLELVATRLKDLIEKSGFSWWGRAINVTASMGATLVRGEDTSSAVILRARGLAAKSVAGGGNLIRLG
ncbi:GGDEF domain-containing protein [Paludibaculum fermentans]|uniref:Diguanylate cyclase n=1 Tax=Paludibaculum fermentans TaxID=1473598 RepID=A0A7S7SK83_PALFE|nr:GGDEF domain-containing protein [Paludibaculum fermentans]QOY88882.1 diguanylate cyclase [Paludibaculum fermentans]